jgi:hypothetical protein
MDIVGALLSVQEGRKVRRLAWTKGTHVVMGSHQGLKGLQENIFLYITSAGTRSFLTLYSPDMNAKDWEIVE